MPPWERDLRKEQSDGEVVERAGAGAGLRQPRSGRRPRPQRPEGSGKAEVDGQHPRAGEAHSGRAEEVGEDHARCGRPGCPGGRTRQRVGQEGAGDGARGRARLPGLLG